MAKIGKQIKKMLTEDGKQKEDRKDDEAKHERERKEERADEEKRRKEEREMKTEGDGNRSERIGKALKQRDGKL